DALERVLASGAIVAGAAPSRSPEMEVALKELRGALQAALAEMPDVERVVILLAYGEDLSQSEIAERLGWPLGTVKTRTRRALLHLRSLLAEDHDPDLRPVPIPIEVGERMGLAALEPEGLDRLMAGDTLDAAAVATHLAGCPACREELGRLRRTA